MLSSPAAVQLNSLLPALTAHARMGATQATTAFSFWCNIQLGQSKNPFSKALGAGNSWDRKKLCLGLQEPSASLCHRQFKLSSSVVQWYLQMQVAENRGLTILLLTFRLEKIVDSDFEPEAFRLECAASVLNPRLKTFS